MLLFLLILLSTFDWMAMRYLVLAWAYAGATYMVLLAIALYLEVTMRASHVIVVTSVAYVISFSYMITVLCPSRYPRDGTEVPDEPRPDPRTVVEYGGPSATAPH